MNKAFTHSNKIELDSHWYLTPDENNGIICVFHEARERKNKKTDELENYTYIEQTFHLRIVQALKHYVDKTQNQCTTLEKLIYRADYNTQLLERLDSEFKQFN